LTLEFLTANISASYADRLFIADDNTDFLKDGSEWLTGDGDYLVEYGDEAQQSKQMLIYNASQEGDALAKIVKFLEKEY